MHNYIRAELYRIFHKKGLYIYFVILSLLYVVSVLMRSTIFSSPVAVSDLFIFTSLPFFIGGPLFASIYNDDLNARTLPPIIGFGRSKVFIALCKLLVTIVMVVLHYLLVFVGFCAIHLLLRTGIDHILVSTILEMLIESILLTIGFILVTNIVTYGIQKPTFSIVAYLILCMELISEMVKNILQSSMISNIFGDLTGYTLPRIASRFSEGIAASKFDAMAFIQYLIYLLVAFSILSIVFNKKELEF